MEKTRKHADNSGRIRTREGLTARKLSYGPSAHDSAAVIRPKNHFIDNNTDTRSDLPGVGLPGVRIRSMWIGLGLPGVGIGSMWVGVGRLPRIGGGWLPRIGVGLPGDLFPRYWYPPRSVSSFADCATQMILTPFHDEPPALRRFPRAIISFTFAQLNSLLELYTAPENFAAYRNACMDSPV